MIPGWLKDAIPRILALIIAGMLWMAHFPEWAIGFLALCLIIEFVYQQWMLGHLANWAALPTRRDLGYRGLGGNAWSQVFERLKERDRLAALLGQQIVAKAEPDDQRATRAEAGDADAAYARAIARIVQEQGVDLVHARSRAPAWSAGSWR